MTYHRRWADPASAQRYPLPAREQAAFRQAVQGWEWRQALPSLASGHIVAASLSAADVRRHQWRIEHQGESWPLLPVPSTKGERPDRSAPAPRISTHIDCWHTHARIDGAELVLWLSEPPDAYLISVSARPLTLAPTLPDPADRFADTPRALSQKTASADIRHHICSPTSVAMVLEGSAPDTITTLCRDEATGMFGSWALAIRSAARHEAVGAVELMSGWQEAERVLDAGLPFCASIRFEKGALPGAPLERTGGHLVVVHGLAEGNVLVHDPAAPSAAEVPRRYDAEAFTHAWLSHRGASYIIVP